MLDIFFNFVYATLGLSEDAQLVCLVNRFPPLVDIELLVNVLKVCFYGRG
jgi:hypothetical protein